MRNSSIRNGVILFRREFASYFATPLALVFIVIFLVLRLAFTFFLGGFYERGQADLAPFFNYHPWLYLFLIPALSMRLWAEERKSGTIELLMTLPITPWQAVLGKFLAAWAVAGARARADVPDLDHRQLPRRSGQRRDLRRVHRQPAGRRRLARDRRVLLGGDAQPGDRVHPDRGRLLPVPAVRLLAGARRVPAAGRRSRSIDAIASLSFLTHFGSIAKGVIDLRDLLYFASVIGVWLIANAIVLDLKKAD